MADNNKQVKRPKVRTFYAANKSLSMGALDMSLNSKDGCVFFKFAPQTAYHADKRAKGEYGWKDAINVKLDVGEIGGIIRALRIDHEFTFIHDFDGSKTTGGVKFYQTDKGQMGFGFHAKRGDKEIKVPVPVGDGELILEFLRFCLDHIFSADYALEKAFWKARNDSKAGTENGSPVGDGDQEVPAEAVAGAPSDDDNPF